MSNPDHVLTASSGASSGRSDDDRVPRPSLRDEDAVDHVPEDVPQRGRGPWDCPECITAGRRGYCAPKRCYCGHDSCHAKDSFVSNTKPTLDNVVTLPTKTEHWDNRDSSWIDKL